MVRDCCLYHHEWFNGCGYWGKHNYELPQYVSFVAISDVFIALMSKRPYKNAWPPNEVMKYIQNKAGTQFNPELVYMLISLIQADNCLPAIFNGGTVNEQQ